MKWLCYSLKYKGPTQCRICLMYGHGQNGCNRKPVCMLCASTEHIFEICPFNKNESDHVVFKCADCHAKQFGLTAEKQYDEITEESSGCSDLSIVIAANSSNPHEAMRAYARKNRANTKWESNGQMKWNRVSNFDDFNVSFDLLKLS